MSIEFTYWWLLFLAIPLIGLSLIPYFKTAKKYRRTRNRILSLVLHCVTIVLVTLALSGITFVRSVANPANELILVVDLSNTQEEAAEDRDGFINGLLKESVYQDFSVGVVTFGLTQVYAVPITSDAGSVYAAYKQAELPDTSATDIEAALEYARTLFNHPESGKIVLVTDGKETDGNIVSSSVIAGIVAQGTKFDAVFVSSDYSDKEFQILSIDLPDVQVTEDTECTLSLNVLSKDAGKVRVNLYDNGEQVKIGSGDEATLEYTVALKEGEQVIPLKHTFTGEGIHEIKAELVPVSEGSSDGMQINNAYYTYVNIEVFNKVLIFEYFEGDSVTLIEMLRDGNMLGEDGLYEVSLFNLQKDTVVRYTESGTEEGIVPETVDDLRAYDQVIMNNIANSDLVNRAIPLDKLLYSYVYEYGGGMLTVGGKDPVSGEAHAYNRRDMYGKDYQKMLPVEAIQYTPPAGVMIVVDVSGSMDTAMQDGESRLYWARIGVTAALDSLSERDKIGIMTLGSDYSDILPLTPLTDRSKIEAAIGKIDSANSGTVFTPSVVHAAEQLRAAQMEKNHIIIISDGEIGEEEGNKCAEYVRQCHEDEKLHLTVSIMIVGGTGGPVTQNIVAASREEGWFDKIKPEEPGSGYYTFQGNGDEISTAMKQDLNSEAIKEIVMKTFRPIVYNRTSQIVQGIKLDGNAVDVSLDGFFGVKKKNLESVDLVLTGEYQVPVYARWKYGKGSVGSFMCDLRSDGWAKDFVASDVGRKLVYNIINDLMPLTSIQPQEINAILDSKNYTNRLSCPTSLNEGESLRGVMRTPKGETVSLNEAGEGAGYKIVRPLNESNKYSVCEFLAMDGGIYIIELQKINAEGNVIASAVYYKEFSYSAEFDIEYGKTDEELKGVLTGLTNKSEGTTFDSSAKPELLFKDMLTELTFVFDPRLILMVFALALFLLDIAVRKFKFKWIHEIVRDRKEKKQGGTDPKGGTQ